MSCLRLGRRFARVLFDEEKARGISAEAARRDAKAREKEFVAQWGVNLEVAERMHKRFINMTAEQRAEYDKIIAQGEQVEDMWNDIGNASRAASDKVILAWRQWCGSAKAATAGKTTCL